MRNRIVGIALALAVASSLVAYTRLITPNGSPERRIDTGGVQFLINDKIVPGLLNADGDVWITADSDPVGALRAAVATWAGVTTAGLTFAPVGTTALVADGSDENHVFVFEDTPENRAVTGGANAVTLGFFTSDGIIVDTDIIFNPVLSGLGQSFAFGTNGDAATFDIEAIALHELGHALGGGHTSVQSATMFQSGKPGDQHPGTLDHDDLAMISEIYPAPGNAALFGSISGIATFAGGGPIRAGSVTAVDPESGTAVSSLSSRQDGSYEITGLPPGGYQVFIEPLNGPVRPSNVRLVDSDADTSFQTTFFGDNNSPTTIQVQAGATAAANIAAPSGDSPVEIELLGQDVGGGSFSFSGIGLALDPGAEAELVAIGPGVGQATATILGNAVQLAGATSVINFTDGTQGLSIPVQVVAGATLKEAGRRGQNAVADAVATLVLNSGGAVSVSTSGLIVPNAGAPSPPTPAFTSAGVVSAASFLGGGVAPGEIVSIFGADMGPTTGAQPAGFDPGTGLLGSTLAGVTVMFDGQPAPLFFVRADQINAQVPFEVSGQANTSVVVSFNGLTSSATQVPVVSAHPALFVLQGSAIVIHNDDGSLNSPSNPVQRGKAVLLFGSGQGVVAPAIATGQPAGASPLSLANGLQLSLGNVSFTPFFAGLSPNFVGLLQINALIPANAPTGGSVPLSISIQGAQSQPGLTIAIAP